MMKTDFGQFSVSEQVFYVIDDAVCLVLQFLRKLLWKLVRSDATQQTTGDNKMEYAQCSMTQYTIIMFLYLDKVMVHTSNKAGKGNERKEWMTDRKTVVGKVSVYVLFGSYQFWKPIEEPIVVYVGVFSWRRMVFLFLSCCFCSILHNTLRQLLDDSSESWQAC